jgi:hypothetical protein
LFSEIKKLLYERKKMMNKIYEKQCEIFKFTESAKYKDIKNKDMRRKLLIDELDELLEIVDIFGDKNFPCNKHEEYIINKYIEKKQYEIFEFTESARYKDVKNKDMRRKLLIDELDKLLEVKFTYLKSGIIESGKEQKLKENIIAWTLLFLLIILVFTCFYSVPSHEKTAQQEILMGGIVSIVSAIIAGFK